MKVYNIEETCEILKLKAPVLRKYSALLEDAGYSQIQRNSNNSRYYTDENLHVLRELIDYKRSGHMTLTDAAKAISTRINGIDVIEDVTPANLEYVAQQADVIKLQNAILALTDHLKETDKKHAESMNEVLKELQNVKKELHEMKVEQTATIESKEVDLPIPVEEKKGFFSRLFKR